ncbi:hypothetical protein SLA2020_517310 [Shorea laevis]
MYKLKRKDIDQVNDDFSDFSLSSPATKIRRLDAELPPIIEEDEIPEAPVIEELSASPVNEERAVVLFKPFNTHLLHSPSKFSVTIDSDIISGFKKQFLQSGNPASLNSADDEAAAMSKTNIVSENECRAVVPWVPSIVPSIVGEDVSSLEAPQSMDPDDMGEASMDIEESNNVSMEQEPGYGFGGLNASEGIQQWPQQHCMIPQPPQNTFTPITWFR